MNGYKFDQNATEPVKVGYEKSYSGQINSYIDRFPWSQKMTHEIITEWEKYKDFLKVPDPVKEAKLKEETP